MKALRRFRFSWSITLIGLLLMVGMCRLSYWQWERYLQKNTFLEELDARLALPVTPLEELLRENRASWDTLLHRRVSVTGSWDFSHEVVKRNRRDDADGPGVHVVTPLKLHDSGKVILVNRGYLPLSVAPIEARKEFQADAPTSFVALIKLSETPRWALSPSEKETEGSRRDEWLRVHIAEIQRQIPYPILPIHLELMSTSEEAAVQAALVKNSKSREEIFYLGDTGMKVSTGALNPDRSYPVPAFSTVVPSATHLLYVFEWIFMALLTGAICIVLQLRRGKGAG